LKEHQDVDGEKYERQRGNEFGAAFVPADQDTLGKIMAQDGDK